MGSRAGTRRSSWGACWLGLCALVSPANAHATGAGDDPPSTLAATGAREADPALLEAARNKYVEAGQKYAAGDRQGACQLLGESVEITPTLGALLNLSTCREHAGDLVAALELLESAQTRAQRASTPTQHAEAIAKAMARVLSKVPSVQLSPAPPTSSKTQVDGREVDDVTRALRLNPGAHVLRLERPGSAPQTLTFELREGQHLTLETPAVEPAPTAAVRTSLLDATDSASQSSTSAYDVLPWALGGTGAALLVTSVVTGQIALSAERKLENECESESNAASGVFNCDASLASTKQRGQNFALATDVLWISGALLAGAGVTLFLLGSDTSTAEVSGGCFAGGCGLSATGRF